MSLKLHIKKIINDCLLTLWPWIHRNMQIMIIIYSLLDMNKRSPLFKSLVSIVCIVKKLKSNSHFIPKNLIVLFTGVDHLPTVTELEENSSDTKTGSGSSENVSRRHYRRLPDISNMSTSNNKNQQSSRSFDSGICVLLSDSGWHCVCQRTKINLSSFQLIIFYNRLPS